MEYSTISMLDYFKDTLDNIGLLENGLERGSKDVNRIENKCVRRESNQTRKKYESNRVKNRESNQVGNGESNQIEKN